jgi:glyoxylase-like metal-dependent hydrolase (beta-lactamase superfamily II)
MATGEILEGVWRHVARHPDWAPGDDWDAEVAWWAVRTRAGLHLIDPLVEEWDVPDGLVREAGGAAAVVRTAHWHERSCPQAAARYGVPVYARPTPPDGPLRTFDLPLAHGQRLPGGPVALHVARESEIAVWLPDTRALVAGDVLLRDGDGRLRLCPASWVGGERELHHLRQELRRLVALEPEHVLVAHGPLVLGDGLRALEAALAG